jgi:hypothetical protein
MCRDLMQWKFFSVLVANAIVASTIPCYRSRLVAAEEVTGNTEMPGLPQLRFSTNHRSEGAQLGPALLLVLEV